MKPRLSAAPTGVLWRVALRDAFFKLDPRVLVRTPVILLTALGALWVSVLAVGEAWTGPFPALDAQIAAWLWFTVLFANFAEALAEGRGKAQAAALRRTRSQLTARCQREGRETLLPVADLRRGDLVLCDAGELIPADGEVIEGIATVDESAVTGESAPVIRESGGDRSAVTGGTRVLSDSVVIRISSGPGDGFLDRMIHLVEGAVRQRTPNEIALSLLLNALTLVFVVVVLTLPVFSTFADQQPGQTGRLEVTVPVLIALGVCLIPTTIGGLLSAIGISGIDRLTRRNVIAMSGRAVEAAGDIDVLLLDKTGTITLGNRQATALVAAPGVSVQDLASHALLSSAADETPEGRSIVSLVKEKYGAEATISSDRTANLVPFSAQTRMSGIDLATATPLGCQRIRKGAAQAIRAWVETQGGRFPDEVMQTVDQISRTGGTPLVVAGDATVLGVIQLKDVVKAGLRDRFAELRRMGIRTVMITGDNELTAAAIAAEAGVDDFLAQATPEMKLHRIRDEQAKGHLVAMTGDGTNDAPALAQADVGVAMNTGTQAAREAGNMVDLDSDPTKLIEVVEVGKQLLMTRGALTTFSIANDLAKYFAILPALFSGLYGSAGSPGPLAVLNVMRLHSPASAILSAVIFNALIIIALIPLALRGVRYQARPAASLLGRNLLFYGLGGLLAPFVGIKLIDLALVGLGWA